MSRIDPLPPEELGELAPILDGMEAQLGFAPNSLKIMGRKPELVKALMAFAGIALAPGSVSAELKNLVAQIVSKSAGCSYCQAHTGHTGHSMGIPADKEAAMWDYETSDKFTEAERAALRVAQGAAQVPNAVTDADFEELKKHYTDEQIVEIVAVIGAFGFFNRWNDTMASELEASPLRYAQEALGPKGWDVGKHA